MSHVTQSRITGATQVPDVVGSAIAVRLEPPNSPATTPVNVPCATAMPLAPADRNDSVRVATVLGAAHVPGPPVVNGAHVGLLISAMNTSDGSENSAGARTIPVVQSSPEESSSPGMT